MPLIAGQGRDKNSKPGILHKRLDVSTWIKSNTTGIRYRLHANRKHGVGFDKYFTIRYKTGGKEKSEGLGWASEGWSEKKAAAILSELKANHTTGTGPRTLTEKRELRTQAERDEAKCDQEEKARNITFGEIFTERYYPQVQHNRRSLRSIQREDELYRLWISQIIGNRPIREVMPLHLEKIKKNMAKEGKSARSIQYCLAVVRQTFNYALKNNLFIGKNPAGATGGVSRPKVDNRRTRFLTREEAGALLKKLSDRSPSTHDMTQFSLHTGARAGEVFNLTWGDVDLLQGTVVFKDTKSGKNRHAYLTDTVKNMLAQRRPKSAVGNSLVFSRKNGNLFDKISRIFTQTVVELGFNTGVTDRRQRVTFHTLRHTYASWLAIDGVDLYLIKELLGHGSIQLTERYSHLSESALKQAAMRINQG
jgi:integrase